MTNGPTHDRDANLDDALLRDLEAVERKMKAPAELEPPPEIDAAILAAARREVGARPAPLGHFARPATAATAAPRLARSRVPMAIAATIILGVSLGITFWKDPGLLLPGHIANEQAQERLSSASPSPIVATIISAPPSAKVAERASPPAADHARARAQSVPQLAAVGPSLPPAAAPGESAEKELAPIAKKADALRSADQPAIESAGNANGSSAPSVELKLPVPPKETAPSSPLVGSVPAAPPATASRSSMVRSDGTLSEASLLDRLQKAVDAGDARSARDALLALHERYPHHVLGDELKQRLDALGVAH